MIDVHLPSEQCACYVMYGEKMKLGPEIISHERSWKYMNMDCNFIYYVPEKRNFITPVCNY